MKKKILGLGLAICLVTSLVTVTGCDKKSSEESLDNIKKQSIENLKDTDIEKYLLDDQKIIKDCIDKMEDEINNAESKEDIEKIEKDFEDEISLVPDKQGRIKILKKDLEKSIKEFDKKDRKKAEKIINDADYEGIKTNSDISKLKKKLSKKIEKAVKEKIKEDKPDNEKKDEPKKDKDKSKKGDDKKKADSSVKKTDSKKKKDTHEGKKWVPEKTKIINHPAVVRDRKYIKEYVCQCGRSFSSIEAWTDHRPHP